MNAGLWFAGWAIVLSMLWGMSKFGPTRVILYWLLWMSIIFLLITYADELSSLVQGALGSNTNTSATSNQPLTNATNSTSQTQSQNQKLPNTNKTITK